MNESAFDFNSEIHCSKNGIRVIVRTSSEKIGGCGVNLRELPHACGLAARLGKLSLLGMMAVGLVTPLEALAQSCPPKHRAKPNQPGGER